MELEAQSREQFGGMLDQRDPQEYADQAKKLCPNIQVEFIAKDEIDRHAPFLDTKWKGVMGVPNTHKVHCVQAVGLENVKVADVSNEMETSFRMCHIRNDNTTLVATPAATPAATSTSKHDIPVEALNLSIGQWVLVSYEGNEFPGEVTSMDDSDIEVNVIHRSANAWKWPRPEDKNYILLKGQSSTCHQPTNCCRQLRTVHIQ